MPALSLSDTPQLSPEETESWYYPAFNGRPYTKQFADILVDLILMEEQLWRFLKFFKQRREPITAHFDLLPYGHRSLPNWHLSFMGQEYQGGLESSTTILDYNGRETVLYLGNQTLLLPPEEDWSSSLSGIGQVLSSLLSYTEAIYLVSDSYDQISLS